MKNSSSAAAAAATSFLLLLLLLLPSSSYSPSSICDAAVKFLAPFDMWRILSKPPLPPHVSPSPMLVVVRRNTRMRSWGGFGHSANKPVTNSYRYILIALQIRRTINSPSQKLPVAPQLGCRRDTLKFFRV